MDLTTLTRQVRALQRRVAALASRGALSSAEGVRVAAALHRCRVELAWARRAGK